MEPNKIVQKASQPKLNLHTCCPQVDDQVPEEAPQLIGFKLLAERENISSPYYHREIF